MSKLFEELKRRKVFRVAAVYGVVAWLLIQVANNLVPALQLPAWTNSFIVLLLLIGLPIPWLWPGPMKSLQMASGAMREPSPTAN